MKNGEKNGIGSKKNRKKHNIKLSDVVFVFQSSDVVFVFLEFKKMPGLV